MTEPTQVAAEAKTKVGDGSVYFLVLMGSWVSIIAKTPQIEYFMCILLNGDHN